MKIDEMQHISFSKDNIKNFLKPIQVERVAELSSIPSKALKEIIKKEGYRHLCEKILDLYVNKSIDNDAASEIFEILSASNDTVRQKKFKHENGRIYHWNAEKNEFEEGESMSVVKYNKIISFLGIYAE